MATAQSPADFPIPADVEGFWQWDKMHCPRPQTAVTEEVFLRGLSEGFSKAMDEFASPVGMTMRVINRYAFSAMIPFDPGAEGMEARIGRYQETTARMVPQIGDLWEREWLPSILPGLDKARAFDFPAMSDSRLLDTLEEMRLDFVQRYVVHGRINFILLAASGFADFYNEVFKPSDPTEPYLLLQGFPTRSVDAGRGLWRLGRVAKANPDIKRLFETMAPGDILPRLAGFDAGRSFAGEFDTYLDEFGWRSDAFEMSDPTWREDPRIPLNTIQGYISLDDDADPEVRFQQAVGQRERLLVQARERLAGDGEKLGRFNELYEMARHYLNVTEDHNYYIDQVGNGVLRLPILEIGRRLAQRNVLAGERDVFLLYLAEMRDGLSGKDQRPLAAQRREELDRWSKIVPPPMIGEPPPPNDDPMGAAFMKMFGMPPEPSRDPAIITGNPASPGTVQGRAKVVRALSEASKVQRGDILVCEMTMPPWTPLFSTVAAVVADTGGVLSHCAIVAREYGLPCVVSTVVGTSVIKDGMMLTVDGSKGIVRIDAQA